ncbi:hypothetical protein L1887_29104 [Cichorium endivia]|nr:hypothetical protein L1887_29104 [Cichorium endivia]
MKEGSGVLVIPRQPMAAVSPSAAYLSPAMGVPTPSPFSYSVASSRWSSSRPSIHIFSLFLRAIVLVFSFASSLALATTMSDNNQPEVAATTSDNDQLKDKQGFQDYTELIYSFVVTTLVLVYSAYQLFKGICDISCRGFLISDKLSDYISFVLDQLAVYLLVSSSSVTTVTISRQLQGNTSLTKAAIVSFSMSVTALFTTAVCAILSGYKLSKRIMW